VFSHFLRTNKFNFREPLSNQKLMEKINSDKNYKPYVTAAAGIDTRL
jgi:radial spoke head protein 4/6